MKVGVLVTDGGPHPPEAWAEATADQIIDISAEAPETRLAEARAFREALVDILAGHHARVQAHERGQLIQHGNARLSQALDPSGYLDEALGAIVAAAAGLSFEGHFQKPETQDYLRALLGQHFATSMHIERSWHAQRQASGA